ncbi:MAG TPA: ABC-F family ATP-binding cassette domain-containing protein [Candidatus Dormibacteraeota bacterium]|nr:ABC-F family ATP-binding cassette domain-containing protein [Candidatus Dormibacteraeota bacterium]
MLSISNLCRQFGSQVVFDHANWTVSERERVALVGANGSGKSTLLRMIAGLDEPDDGVISLPRGWAVGYLPQDGLTASGRTVMAEALGAFADVLALERECREIEEALAHTPAADPAHDGLLARYGDARARWDVEGSYDYESQAERVLLGLGFTIADFSRDAGEFSGGWQMRLALATLLLRRPNILLLDEPTNHLDLEARNWLEDFLVTYPHTVILVAHDRYFLDVTVTRITEVAGARLTDYPAPYSRYLETREAQRAQQAAAYQTQQEEIARIEAFISRFRYQASKATLVQSRIKYLEKLERVPPPEGGSATIHFRFPACERSGREVLRLDRASKRYGELTVYDHLSLTIERGRKVALVGPNGAGKSTLIKMLAGTEPLSGGSRHLGHNVRVGYFAQDQARVLDPDRSVLELATAAAPSELVPQVRSLLGAFLFSGDAVDKKVRVLSGGERNRLALSLLLLHPPNCLLLDEPTNHLDMTAKQVLLEALQRYTGTLVLVAHDRYVLDHLPEEIIEVGAGHATRYLGNYEDYVQRKVAETNGNLPPPIEVYDTAVAAGDEPLAPVPSVAERRAVAKSEARVAARRERDQARLEQEITDKEDALAAVSAVINAPDFYRTHDSPQQLFSRYAELKRDIDALYAKLERLERA